MLALLVPGVGMGGGDASTPPSDPSVSGHGMGKPHRIWHPYLTSVLHCLGSLIRG